VAYYVSFNYLRQLAVLLKSAYMEKVSIDLLIGPAVEERGTEPI